MLLLIYSEQNKSNGIIPFLEENILGSSRHLQLKGTPIRYGLHVMFLYYRDICRISYFKI